MGLNNTTIIGVLVTSECSTGSILAAFGVGVVIAIVNTQKNGTQRVSQTAAIATCKTGNRCTYQVKRAAIKQNRNYSPEGTAVQQHRSQQGGCSS
jgi:hypothetical protein